MAQHTSGSTHLEILHTDGATWLPLMLKRPRDKEGIPIGDGPRTLQEALAAARNDIALAEWLETTAYGDMSAGFGEAYSAAIALDTFSSPGHTMPAGASTEITVTAGNNSASPIVAFAEFGGDL